ncbi:MAG: hypothetical protein M1828_003603 [Chrysothrix sp. TS-e1954]|nr:MAG: hypothetical protein M1828_003603 [Chrysothrix sp. TS-e1954]
MASDPQKKLQTLSETYQKLQTDLQKAVSDRQRLEAQNQENKGVQKEFRDLDTESDIYKLVGSALLKQDRKEAVDEVDGRLRFIADGLKQAETQIKKTQEESERTKTEVNKPFSKHLLRAAADDRSSQILQVQSQAQAGQAEGQAAA